MEELIAIISVIGAVLGIILFFKIWGACNDINEIRKLLSGNRLQHDSTDYSTTQPEDNSNRAPMAEAIYGEEIQNLENKLFECQSDRERLDLLDKFMEGKSQQLKKHTLKGNEHAAMKNWKALIEWASPIYKTMGYNIPGEFINFTL